MIDVVKSMKVNFSGDGSGGSKGVRNKAAIGID